MPAPTFPYKRLGPHYAPVVPVALFGRSLSAQTEAYVDSGAVASIFRLGLLAALGLRKEDGRVETFTVGDGGRLKAYAFRLPVQIGPLRFVARATFSDELRIGFNLLGRQTIFDRFDEIAFNERARQVIFRFD